MHDLERPRIGYVLKRFPRFSETFILNELLAMEARGVGVDVFSLRAPPEEPRHASLSRLRAQVHTLTGTAAASESVAAADSDLFAGLSGKDVARLGGQAAAIARHARAVGIGHLHAHFASDAATVALLAARELGCGFSFTAHARDIYHTYLTPEIDDAKRRAKLREAAFVVTVSDFNAKHLRALCPEAADRIHRIYNGIDLSMFVPEPSRRIPGRIVAVGRLVEKKGFADLIDACALLAARDIAFDCRIVGDGPMREALALRADATGVSDRVIFDGSMPQEALAAMLGTAAAATLPCVITPDGDRDGLPTVLLEAMAKGLPVVTTSVTGGPEIVEHGVTGLVTEPGAPTVLAAALEQILLNPGRAAEMGRAGRARAERLFNLPVNAGQLAALIVRATRTRRPTPEVA